MSDTTAGLLQVGVLLAALAVCYRPLGAYMARVFTSERDLRVERVVYRLVGVDPERRPALAGVRRLGARLLRRRRRRCSTRCSGSSRSCRWSSASPGCDPAWRSTPRRRS